MCRSGDADADSAKYWSAVRDQVPVGDVENVVALTCAEASR